MTIKITHQERMKINKISKERRYITKRHPEFSRRNIQKFKIAGLQILGSRKDMRTLIKYRIYNAYQI